jgi:hypothetical protein
MDRYKDVWLVGWIYGLIDRQEGYERYTGYLPIMPKKQSSV